MAELIDIRLLTQICLEQVALAQRLAPELLPTELLNRSAAAVGCLLPRLPDGVLELALNETARQLEWSLA